MASPKLAIDLSFAGPGGSILSLGPGHVFPQSRVEKHRVSSFSQRRTSFHRARPSRYCLLLPVMIGVGQHQPIVSVMKAISPHFAPYTALLGGIAIGCAVAAQALIFGRVTGISGHLNRVLTGQRPSDAFLLIGLLLAGLVSPAPQSLVLFPISRMVLAGALVAVGSASAGGCTSGHAVCGLARVSRRSFVAVPIFIAVAAITASATRTVVSLDTAASFDWPSRFASDSFTSMVYIALTTAVIGLLAFRTRTSSEKGRTYLSSALQALVGVCFGLGLLVSQMAYPFKVISFLAFKSSLWDPSLMFVFPGALLLGGLAFNALLRRGTSPVMIPKNHSLPTNTKIDKDLLGGSVLFGVGWGLSGM